MNKKTAVTVIITTLIMAAVPLTVYLGQQRQQTVSEAAPETTLSVSPATSAVILDETFTLNIVINSGSNVIFGADLEITFDPTILEAQDAIPGDFLDSSQEITEIIDNQTGKITYGLGAFSSKTGQGTLASISFKALSGGSSEILFGENTSVAASGEDEALSSTQEGVVSVADSGSLSFKVKFQGINQQRADRTIEVILLSGTPITTDEYSVTITADGNGVYEGSISNITFGDYNVYIVGWAHLGKALGSISLTNTEATFDWSGTEISVGDATGDGVINIQDFRTLVENYLQGTSAADFNLDGQTNIQDFRFIAENYLQREDPLPT